MGPLCCPNVLARFPNGQEPKSFLLEVEKKLLQKSQVAFFNNNNDPFPLEGDKGVNIPSFVHILANPSYEPVASRVPSLYWMER